MRYCGNGAFDQVQVRASNLLATVQVAGGVGVEEYGVVILGKLVDS